MYLGILYAALKNTMQDESKLKHHIETFKQIILNSKEFFLADSHGLHTFVQFYTQILTTLMKDSSIQKDKKVTKVCLRVISQIVSISSNFIAKEAEIIKEGKATYALATMNKYMEFQNKIKQLLDIDLKGLKLSNRGFCMYLWINALNKLESRSLHERYQYAQELVERTLSERFNVDLLEKGKGTVIFVILDIVELIVFSAPVGGDLAIAKRLSILLNTIIELIEDKVPSEAANYKKLNHKKGDEYEKVLCASIRLCLCISNILVDIDNV